MYDREEVRGSMGERLHQPKGMERRVFYETQNEGKVYAAELCLKIREIGKLNM